MRELRDEQRSDQVNILISIFLVSTSNPSASGTPKEANTTTDNTLQAAVEWSNDHQFLSPNDIYEKALGLLYCLTTKQLFKVPYTTLCRRR